MFVTALILLSYLIITIKIFHGNRQTPLDRLPYVEYNNDYWLDDSVVIQRRVTQMWSNLEEGDIRLFVAKLMNGEENVNEFISFEKFLEKTKLKNVPVVCDFFHQCKHVHFMYVMKWAGVWELSWDVFPDNDNIDLFPIELVKISLEELGHGSFPALLAELKLFKSASEAKKNGWNKPLQKGDFFFKKKTYILRIGD